MTEHDGAVAPSALGSSARPRPGAYAAGPEAFTSLVLAAQAGAQWACTDLWVAYAPAVAAFLRARGSHEPDDLTSEVFLTVFDRLHTFEGGEADFRSFVFTVAYRRLTDELRRRGRRGVHEPFDADADPRRVPSAEHDALRNLGDAAALELLDGLSRDQRDVMVLRVVADLTVEQVAEVLGKRPGAVKALQRRALETLRRKVRPTRTPARGSDDGRE
ncbi:RNA polymerase sigma factor [Agromyces indicus]|uniref:Sigma-70 family RNA polymerase sigma factor n=1 Tax=Agromyces indicus TaxID=758919 RepID=A0ABU1FFY3_9MICO|nr:sigma-70 family RNA polymerase sigma factor [Agromyces indicus]MDR5690670.1 sigma-70 family RNA polymerase sigma factor [Agromyces indicus]